MKQIVANSSVGLFCIGLDVYWKQFEGLKDYVLGNCNKIHEMIGNECNVVFGGLVDSYEKGCEVNQLFRKHNISLIFCYCATYSPSSNVVSVVSGLEVPVIVLNLQPEKSPDFEKVKKIGDWLGMLSVAGSPEVTAVLLKMGLRFSVITGVIENDQIVKNEISEWCKIANALSSLRGGKIGFFGHAYPGMMDLYVDESKLFNELGIFTEFLEFHQIKNFLAEAGEEDIAFFDRMIVENFEMDVSRTSAEYRNLCRVSAGLYALVKKINLKAIAMHYAGEEDGEFKNIYSPMNVVFSLLTKLGIPCCVEGDIKTTIAMLISKCLTGCCATGELYGVDFDDDVCLIGHSGSSDFALSHEKASLRESEVFHGKTGKGYLTQFKIKEGPVTIFALSEDSNGKYRFIVASGTSENGNILNLGDTNTRVRFAYPIREFLNRWCLSGPSHHFNLTVGNHVSLVEKMGLALGLEVVGI